VPRYSIVIPTRRRHDTLRYAIETAVSQRFKDFEVVVANNGGDPATTQTVEDFRNQGFPVRETVSDRPLSMAQNWEAGLDACQGDYVTVLGDDDGLLPETLSYADRILQATNSALLHWTYHDYFWPGTANERSQNHLIIRYAREETLVTQGSRQKLEAIYTFKADFCSYPMIYNGFVRKDIIAAVKARCGAYFACEVPDVFSAIANLCCTDSFVSVNRPLAIRGTSRSSNSNTMQADRQQAEEALDVFHKEADKQGKGIHPSVFQSPLGGIMIPATFLVARDFFFPNDPILNVGPAAMLGLLAGSAARMAGLYDLSVEHMHRLAQMHGIPRDAYSVPERPPAPNPHAAVQTGPLYAEDGSLSGLVVNGALCGLATVADAMRLVSALTPLPQA
jgi:Glycosyl transferase family 2